MTINIITYILSSYKIIENIFFSFTTIILAIKNHYKKDILFNPSISNFGVL